MTELNEKILKLRSEGKSYRQIQKILNCSKGTVSYFLGKGQKDKAKNRMRSLRTKQHPFIRKLENFIQINNRSIQNIKLPLHKKRKLIQLKLETFFKDRNTGKYMKPTITFEEVINKLGTNPICYLTGVSIDIDKPRTYAFDHIIPRSRGGENTIENLAICTKQANQAKFDMTPEEFISFCKKVVEYNNKVMGSGVEPASHS